MGGSSPRNVDVEMCLILMYAEDKIVMVIGVWGVVCGLNLMEDEV